MNKATWDFFAVRDASPWGFTWQWRKHGVHGAITSAAFKFYFDCLSDARAKGYLGTPPEGPRVPLPELPEALNEAHRIAQLSLARPATGRATTVKQTDRARA